MPRKPNATNNLLAARPKLAEYYSSNNTVPGAEVFKTDTREFLFTCMGCGEDFVSSPSRIKGRFELVYCSHCHEIKNQHQSFLKMQDKVTSKGSLADQFPDIATSWVRTCDYNFPYTPSAVTSQATIKVLWQCPHVEYHQWEMRVDNRVNFSGCPYCCKKRIHILDSYYTVLKNKGLLRYLHEGDVEAAKNYSIGSSKGTLRHYCKTCDRPYETIPNNFLKLNGCSNCYKSNASDTRRKNLVLARGSIADNEQLSQQYCYDQSYINSEKRNSLPPEEVPLSYTKSVWWLCPKGHYTKATPANRYRGDVCGKCSNSTSLLEIILYTELASLADLLKMEFRHKYNDRGNEVDIAIQELKYAIEVDGYEYHRNRLAPDRQKQIDVMSLGYRLIRVRDSRLTPLNESVNISFDKKHVEPKSVFADEDSSKRRQSHDHICNILNQICAEIGINHAFHDLSHLKEAQSTWLNTRQVKFEDSVAYQYPNLLKDFDLKKNPPDLLKNVTYGSTIVVQWICHKCGYEWPTTVHKRTSESTGCPSCAGQKVSDMNAVGTLFSEIVDAFVNRNDAFRFTAGSGHRTLFRCTFPGCTVEPQERAIKDVVKRFKQSGTTHFYKCKHR
ncbi:MAG: hypothetical protein HRU48_20500 [Vibrio sp.]|uniref:zinc-ribbon domain-containing protein n=1 Tax=Vibrio TaxID=662 RepID=UPI001EBF4A7F|nr:zinc-ribbon domain-containing protein [Vibrio sp.]NRB69714.1 hypothetical protein [Vibrio sp.]